MTSRKTPTLADDRELTPDASELAIQNMPAVQKKRQERTQLNDIINRLVMPDAPSAKGTSGSLARLDRRMSVFEKALADMEVRYNAIERDKADVVKVFSDDMKALTARVEAGEKRALEITSELRGGILDAKTRLAAVEAIMSSTKMGPGPSLVSPVAPMDAEAPKVDFTPTPLSRDGFRLRNRKPTAMISCPPRAALPLLRCRSNLSSWKKKRTPARTACVICLAADRCLFSCSRRVVIS